MPDYKNNQLLEWFPEEQRLDNSILKDIASPNNTINHPDFTVATVSRIMSNYIRTLRNVATRKWQFEVLNLFEFAYPLFINFYECVVANELAWSRNFIDFSFIYKVGIMTNRGNLTLSAVEKDKLDEEPPAPELDYRESNFMKVVRVLSYYFQSPDKIGIDFLPFLEDSINLSAVFNQWMNASENPSNCKGANLDNLRSGELILYPNAKNKSPIITRSLKEALKDGGYKYEKAEEKIGYNPS